MTYYEEEGGRITTTTFFLDGEIIELFFCDGVLSDRGQAYEAIVGQTDVRLFPTGWLVNLANEISLAYSVQYRQGVFSLAHVTESTLEDAIFRLVNVMLLFYGINVGAYRINGWLVT